MMAYHDGKSSAAQLQMTHASSLLASLEKLQEREELCDFTIKVKGHSIQTHKVVLSACSSYFQAMCMSGMRESHAGYVDMKGVEFDAVKYCVDFIYTGRAAALTVEDAKGVIHVSSLMQLTALTSWCFQNLVTKLSVGNCLAVKGLADSYCDEEASELSEKFLLDNFKGVVRTKSFVLLRKDEVVRYMKLADAGRCDLRSAAINWMKHDVKVRGKYAVELLGFLRTDSTPRFLIELLEDPVVSELKACTEFVTRLLYSDIPAIEEHLGCDNCFVYLRLLRTYQNHEVSDALTKFLAKNFSRIAEKKEFLNMTDEEVCSLFRQSGINYKKLWKAVAKWLKFNSNRYSDFGQSVLRSINLTKLPLKFLLMKVLRDGITENYNDFRRRVIERLVSNITALKQKITSVSWFDFYRLAQEAPDPYSVEVETAVKSCMVANYRSVSADERFKTLSKNDVLSLLDHDYGYFCESVKWAAALDWTNHESSRQSEFIDLLKHIKIERLPNDIIRTIQNAEPVKSSLACLQWILQCMSSKLTCPRSPCIAIFDEWKEKLVAIDVGKKKSISLCEIKRQKIVGVVSLNENLFVANDKALLQMRSDGTWEKITRYRRRWSDQVCVVALQNAIYFVESDGIYWYDLTERHWFESCPPTKFGARFFVAASENAIYCLGGNAKPRQATMFVPSSKCWYSIPEMRTGLIGGSATFVAGNLYVLGFDQQLPYALRVCVYCPATNSWRQLFTRVRSGCISLTSCGIDGKIYALSNYILRPSSTFEVYDPASNEWETFFMRESMKASTQACLVHLFIS